MNKQDLIKNVLFDIKNTKLFNDVIKNYAHSLTELTFF